MDPRVARPQTGRDAVNRRLIPEALHVDDEDLARALGERAAAMEARAHALAERAVTSEAAWVRTLGPMPVDPGQRGLWLREVATVAAYRERWEVTGADPVSAIASSVERAGHERRAAQAVQLARALTADPLPQKLETPSGLVPAVRDGIDL
jgi:hypothetical protein